MTVVWVALVVAALVARLDMVSGALALTLAIATAIAQMGLAMPALVAALACLDAIVVLSMLAIVMRVDGWNEISRRAQIVGLISLCKVGLALAYASLDQTRSGWNLYATLNNTGFALQCLVAGGFLNGLGSFVANSFGRISDRALGIFSNQKAG